MLESLERLLGSAARVAVLMVLLVDPVRAYYQRQLEAATGHPIRAVQRELERLTGLGLLYRHAEGRRTYYRVDMDCPLYRALRALVLLAADEVQRLRAELTTQRAVRLAFLSGDGARALAVLHEGEQWTVSAVCGTTVETMTSGAFRQALADKAGGLTPFLVDGCDLLGRRDDVIWRHIGAAGYAVRKGAGVP